MYTFENKFLFTLKKKGKKSIEKRRRCGMEWGWLTNGTTCM